MSRKSNNFILLIGLFLSLLFTFACQLVTSKLTSLKSSDLRFSINGKVTDIWAWGSDFYTCQTQDDMKLTVNYENGAVLTLHGTCFGLPIAHEACTEIPSSLPCGLVIYGVYSEAGNGITFTDCNSPKENIGRGKLDLLSGGKGSPTIYAGEASCSFRNTYEQHTIRFK
jgi:hypothetical protein